MHGSGDSISVATSNESQGIQRLKERENIILMEQTHNEAVDNSMEQVSEKTVHIDLEYYTVFIYK